MIPFDCHTHTRLCRHATGEPAEYVAAARQRGLKAIAFTDHCPIPDGYFASVRMQNQELADYRRWVLTAQNDERLRSDGIEVLYGIEMDILPPTKRTAETSRILETEPFDFALGSVHYQAQEYSEWETQSGFIDQPSRVRAYFGLLADGARSDLYDCLAHIDLIELPVGPFDPQSYRTEIMELLDACAETGTAIELNTSGLMKSIKRCFPAPAILQWAVERGVKLTVGSDAHAPSYVGFEFGTAEALLSAAGAKEIYFWRKREPVAVPL